jgi:hypothetical protein
MMMMSKYTIKCLAPDFHFNTLIIIVTLLPITWYIRYCKTYIGPQLTLKFVMPA